MTLNRKVRTLKRAMIDARGEVVRAIARNRSPEKVLELRTRAHAVWQQLERALDEGFKAPLSHA